MDMVTQSKARLAIRGALENRYPELKEAEVFHQYKNDNPPDEYIPPSSDEERWKLFANRRMALDIVDAAVARQGVGEGQGMTEQQIKDAYAYALKTYQYKSLFGFSNLPTHADIAGKFAFLDKLKEFAKLNKEGSPLVDIEARLRVDNSVRKTIVDLDKTEWRNLQRKSCSIPDKDHDFYMATCRNIIELDKATPALRFRDAAKVELARTLIDTALLRCKTSDEGPSLLEDEIECAEVFVEKSYGPLLGTCKLPNDENEAATFRDCLKGYHDEKRKPPPDDSPWHKRLWRDALRLWRKYTR